MTRFRLPWVSRHAYDAATTYAAEAVANVTEQLHRAEHRYDELLSRYHALKIMGGDTEPARLAPLALPERDVIDQAIAARAGNDRALARHLRDQVTMQRILDDKTTDQEIAAAILAGEPDPLGAWPH